MVTDCDEDLGGFFEILDLVSHQDPYFVPQVLHNALIKNMMTHTGINSTQWIIQQTHLLLNGIQAAK
ncbi:hypothetical protein E2C01_035959 [Portunus trituberculatus]|uniref:Uncharacterized protein n=1 Tax=Portunus trituberculatus TaxID=210409 RepID=A0A5B7FAP6_PORTR|nr:hypothetical protein [Portunus trituberculatus]